MFNNLSTWVSEKTAAIPPVHMPAMPAMPNMAGMTSGVTNMFAKKEGGDEELAELAKAAQEEAANNDSVEPKSEGSVVAEGDKPLVDETSRLKQLELDTAKTLESAKEISSNIGSSAIEMGSNIGSMFMSFGASSTNYVKNASTAVSSATINAGSKLKEVIEKNTIVGDFTKENENFINDKKVKQRREDAGIPPWVGFNEEEKMKEQILALSLDSRNFLRAPPPGVDFPFDFNVAYPVAIATLEEDPNLKEMRFTYVPKQISEENFWRNYFYRVSLVKQSTQLDELSNATTPKPTSNTNNTDKKRSGSQVENQNNTNEFVSDDQEEINYEDMKSELKQLKLVDKKDADLEEWEKELPEELDNISAEELEREINQMIEN